MPRLLHDRLIDFSVATGAASDSMPPTPSGAQLASQLARCGSSPAANYAEARDSASDKEYAYKMQLCVRELREALVWIQVAGRRGYQNADYAPLQAECNELIAIAVTCCKKARSKLAESEGRIVRGKRRRTLRGR